MFRTILQFMSRRWVLGLAIVIISGWLLWFAGPLIAVADYRPLELQAARFSLILLLLLVWGFDNLRIRNNERAAGETLTRDLAAPVVNSEAEAADAEQGILAQKLRDALKVLQRTRFAKSQRLYQLPWYVVIGAPGSGKTTALKNAGLRFPLESQLGDSPVQGAGGTRYCDWWFTDQAVLLDTAGRYTTQDNPKEDSARAWLGFLGDLRKGRPRRPLNGVIVAVNVQDLVNKTQTQLAMQAAAIKRRIQELNEHLDMELPVYVMFTKCDLIAGFAEFFSDLEQEDRQQPWGFSLPLRTSGVGGAGMGRLSEQFRSLIERASGRVLYRLNGETDPGRRSLLFDFPRQMLGMQSRMEAFLQDIFVPNQFEQPALLRGVYFVSGTQSDAARQWVAGVLPPALCSSPVNSTIIATPRGFFLEQLFKQIIFGESELAAANLQARRRFRWIYGVILAVIGITFSAAVVAILVSHRANITYLSSGHQHLDEYRKAPGRGLQAGERDWIILAQDLRPLRTFPGGFASGDEGPPIDQRFGLDQSAKLGAEARRVYLASLERRYLPRLAAELARQLTVAGDSDDHLYEALRFYLMLHRPQKMERDAFLTWAGLIWAQHFPGDEAASLRAELASHLEAALDAGISPPAIDANRVEAAREGLARTSLERRAYRRLKQEYLNELTGEFSVAGVLGRKAEALFYRRSGLPLDQGVPEFFSYKIFHTRFNLENKTLANRLEEERWVYGDNAATSKELADIADRVTELYFEDYELAWRGLLQDLAIKRFDDPDDGRTVTRLLAGTDAPLAKLLLAVREHTALGDVPESGRMLARAAAESTDNVMVNQQRRLESMLSDVPTQTVSLPGSPVSDAFVALNEFATLAEGLPLQRLQQSFAGLNRYLDTLAESSDRNLTAFKLSREAGNGSAVVAEVRSALAGSPAVVQAWFGSLPADTEQVTQHGTHNHANEAWRAEVMPFYEKAIRGRYPIHPTSSQEIRLDDFARFFGPEGILDSYFKRYIEPFADTSKREWAWRKRVGLSTDVLRLFQRIKLIEEAWFEGPGQPRVDFSLKPYLLDAAATRALLDVSGAMVTYGHGPVRATSVQWPGGASDQSRLVLNLASQGTPVSIRSDGDWSWFRLLDRHAKAVQSADGAIMLSFAIDGLNAQYQLRPSQATNPFTNNAVRHFSLPGML